MHPADTAMILSTPELSTSYLEHAIELLNACFIQLCQTHRHTQCSEAPRLLAEAIPQHATDQSEVDMNKVKYFDNGKALAFASGGGNARFFWQCS